MEKGINESIHNETEQGRMKESENKIHIERNEEKKERAQKERAKQRKNELAT